MYSLYIVFAFLLALSRRSLASFPVGAIEAPAVHSPLPAPIAFSNGPIFTSLTPSIDPVHHTPTIEIRNVIRTGTKEAGHFSGTMHRSSGIPGPIKT
ncbi:hypothetical protein RB195_004311 [Necator americanus]|uniref:Secreted protein n=1 Tax=Necator americanus TaxID=51031 RepID=A0ABR1BLC2_NECAM